MSPRCGAPVVVPGVFSATEEVVGHCVRAAGHDGRHRWTSGWESLDPADVEALIAADEAAWEPEDDT